MAAHTLVNLSDVEDSAVTHGMAPALEARFVNADLGLEKSGLSYQRLGPSFRFPFGHLHTEQEEVYVILDGGGRAKVEDEIVELRRHDVLRVGPGVTRSFESGPDGMEMVVFGAPNTGPSPGGDAEAKPGWWAD